MLTTPLVDPNVNTDVDVSAAKYDIPFIDNPTSVDDP